MARKTQLSTASISLLAKGRTTDLRGANASAIAKVLGVRTEWLVAGTPPMLLASEVPGVHVPLLPAMAAAGLGEESPDGDAPVAHIVLDQEFVRRVLRPTSPAAVRCLHALGDSMEPTIKDGDLLLVDTGVLEPRVDCVYVMRAHGRLFVKRLRQRVSDGKFEITSDNPAHRTSEVLSEGGDIELLGRVIFIWHAHKI